MVRKYIFTVVLINSAPLIIEIRKVHAAERGAGAGVFFATPCSVCYQPINVNMLRVHLCVWCRRTDSAGLGLQALPRESLVTSGVAGTERV